MRMEEFIGMDTDKDSHQYFRLHWRHFFPGIGVRTTSVRQAANLWKRKEFVRLSLFKKLYPNGCDMNVIDGLPMPVCGFSRIELDSMDVDLQTLLKSNMKDPRPKWLVGKIRGMRRIIETVISQLSGRLHIEKVRARDRWHLTTRTVRKLLAHTVACFLCHENGYPMLQFDNLLG